MCSYVSPSSREPHDQGLEVINESSMYKFIGLSRRREGWYFCTCCSSSLLYKIKKDFGIPHWKVPFNFSFFFFAALHNTWDLSSLTRDQTHAPCIGSADFHQTAREVPQRYLKVQVINGKHFTPLVMSENHLPGLGCCLWPFLFKEKQTFIMLFPLFVFKLYAAEQNLSKTWGLTSLLNHMTD